MSIQVISAECNDRQGTVTIQGDTMEECQGSPAKQLALQQAAAKGISRPGLSGGDTTYPVDANGETSDDLVLGRAGKAVAFRCDYKVTGGI